MNLCRAQSKRLVFIKRANNNKVKTLSWNTAFEMAESFWLVLSWNIFFQETLVSSITELPYVHVASFFYCIRTRLKWLDVGLDLAFAVFLCHLSLRGDLNRVWTSGRTLGRIQPMVFLRDSESEQWRVSPSSCLSLCHIPLCMAGPVWISTSPIKKVPVWTFTAALPVGESNGSFPCRDCRWVQCRDLIQNDDLWDFSSLSTCKRWLIVPLEIFLEVFSHLPFSTCLLWNCIQT